MRLFAIFTALVAAATAVGLSFEPRQTSPNARIGAIVSAHSQSVWLNVPRVMQRLAEGNPRNATTNVDALIVAYAAASAALNLVPASPGSETIRPTNAEVHTWFVLAIQQTCASLSGLNERNVPGITSRFDNLDTQMVRMITVLDSKLPGTADWVQTFMLDGKQFCDLIGLDASVAAMTRTP